MRLGDYLRFAWRGVWRQRVRTAITVLALAISATIVISLVSITLGAQRTITKERRLTQGLETMVVTPNAVMAGGLFGTGVQVSNAQAEKITDATVATLTKTPGVRAATPLASVPELQRFAVAGFKPTFVAPVVAPGTDTMRLRLDAGKLPASGRKGYGQVVLGGAFVEALGLEATPAEAVGRTVTFTTIKGYRGAGADVPAPGSPRNEIQAFAEKPTTVRAKVVGVTGDPRLHSQVVVSLPWAHAVRTPQIVEKGELTIGESAITAAGYGSVVVDAAGPESVTAVSARIKALGYGVSSTQEQIARINRYVLIMWLVLGSISLVSLVTAGLGIANTMLMTITEERYAINVWRVCGAPRALIRRLYVLQAAALSAIGGVLGMALGYALTWVLARQIGAVLADRGMESLTVAEATPPVLGAGLALTLAVGILAALYPAHRASRCEPGAFLSAA